jgi:murein DD-endopeptidase MepM/ murein hydrolase activator NlpD
MSLPIVLAALLAASTPSLELAPASVRPGDAVLVKITGAPGPEAPRGTVAGRPVTFWRDGAEWRALAALPIETRVGPAQVEVDVGGAHLATPLEVVAPGFASKSLRLAAKYVEPPASVQARIAADRKAFAAAQLRAFEPPLFAANFALPRHSGTTGRFGDQRIVNGKQASVHYGLDLVGARGEPIEATDDGVVVLARDAYMSGKSVVIWHGAGVYSLYFHMDRIRVKEGARVRQGELLGVVGTTGKSTGPHLHWSMKVDGLYVDPESIMAIDFRTGTALARVPPTQPSPAAAPSAAEPPPAEAPKGAEPEAAPPAVPVPAVGEH